MNKQSIIFIGVVLVAVAAVIVGVVVRSGNTDTTSYPEPDVATYHVKGNPDASIIIAEYSDFQCPFCAQYAPLIDQVLVEYGDVVRFEYHHRPLRNIHPNAQLAAQAAEAAGVQGMFWDMHDLLFANQNEWADRFNPKSAFVGYAQDLVLDVDQFESDLTSRAVQRKVNEDHDAAVQLGVNSTPSIAVNGQLINPPGSVEAFGQIIETARR